MLSLNSRLHPPQNPNRFPHGHLQDEEVTVFGHFLHMHATGQHMVTRQYRDDVLIKTARVEYYAFEQAGGYVTAYNSSETIKVRSLRNVRTLCMECIWKMKRGEGNRLHVVLSLCCFRNVKRGQNTVNGTVYNGHFRFL